MFEQIVIYIVIGTVLIFVLNFLGGLFTDFKDFVHDKETEDKLRKKTEEYINKKLKEERESVISKFYGLFEFHLENCPDEENFKKDFCSIVSEKIKSKYKNSPIQLTSTDKIFFNCSDFFELEGLVDDFVKLFNFIADINKKRMIKTDLKFSLWAESGSPSKQKAFKVLSEMNGLSIVNQVITNEGIYNQYQKQKNKLFEFHPQGTVKLIENDDVFELYRLLKRNIT